MRTQRGNRAQLIKKTRSGKSALNEGMWLPQLNNRQLPVAAFTEGVLLFRKVGPYQVILSVLPGSPIPATDRVRGARINPRTNPAINPQRCAAMLTCGVDRSNAVCIA